MEPTRQQPRVTFRQAHFGLWDTICIIVGIIVGSGIFRTPGTIFEYTGGAVPAIAVWLAGGLLAIVGALCFAELASTYPRSGGEYVYLTRAFGSWAGFLYVWGQLLIIRTGASLVVMAYVFSEFATRFFEIERESAFFPYYFTGLALLAVVGLTVINVVGVRSGKWTQNTLTTVKILGLVCVLAVGFAWAHNKPPSEEYLAFQGRVIFTGEDSLILATNDSPSKEPKTAGPFILAQDYKLTIDGQSKNSAKQDLKPADFQDRDVKVLVRAGEPTRAVRVKSTDHSFFGALSLALIFVLWTYAGWHEASYIAAEVRNPRRNLPLALWGGTAAVIALYLLVNVAYLTGLGFEAAADAQLVAADVLKLGPWTFGEKAICLLIMISSLGAVNGIIFTSSRIFSEFGSDHSLFAALGQCNRRFGTPAISLLVQGGISVFTILMVACFFESQDSFDEVVKGTAPVFWLFFLLTGFALFALRRKDRNIERPFTVPLYPLTPLVYCAFCAMMLYGSVAAAFEEKLSGWFVIVTLFAVLAGVPLYLLSRHKSRIPVTVQRTEDREVQTI